LERKGMAMPLRVLILFLVYFSAGAALSRVWSLPTR
jgi:hypothetical protein